MAREKVLAMIKDIEIRRFVGINKLMMVINFEVTERDGDGGDMNIIFPSIDDEFIMLLMSALGAEKYPEDLLMQSCYLTVKGKDKRVVIPELIEPLHLGSGKPFEIGLWNKRRVAKNRREIARNKRRLAKVKAASKQ